MEGIKDITEAAQSAFDRCDWPHEAWEHGINFKALYYAGFDRVRIEANTYHVTKWGISYKK